MDVARLSVIVFGISTENRVAMGAALVLMFEVLHPTQIIDKAVSSVIKTPEVMTPFVMGNAPLAVPYRR